MDELRAYEILGLNEGCSREDIKTAYAKFSKEYHPEEYPDEFQQIHEAYSVLTRRVRRGGGNNLVKEDDIYTEYSEKIKPEKIISKEKEPEEEESEETKEQYDFEKTLRKGERQEWERTHEIVLRALAEVQILLTPQYCHKMKLFREFFAKEEYKAAIRTAEFMGVFADLLAGSELKKEVYSYFVNVYRLRGANQQELIPEAQKLYKVLERKVGRLQKRNNDKFVYIGILTTVVIVIRSAKIPISQFQAIGVFLYLAALALLGGLMFRKLYENHSSIFSQMMVAILMLVIQIAGVFTPFYGMIFGSVEMGDVFGVFVMFLMLLWCCVLAVLAIVKKILRKVK